jgi:hypothetical protein
MKMSKSQRFFTKLPGRGGGLHFESDYDVINGPQLQRFPAGIIGEAASLEIAANNSMIVGDSYQFGNILKLDTMYHEEIAANRVSIIKLSA